MRIDIGADVVDSGGAAAGKLSGLVFEREARRVAGFLVRVDGALPREVFIMPGQAARIEQGRVALALSGDEFAALPDARQHLYVTPEQDLAEEVAAAESASASPAIPDPDERPTPSAIPGIALVPNLFIPFEVERSAFGENEVALENRLRVITDDGEELGQFRGAVVNDDAQLVGIVVGNDERVIDYDRLDQLDDDANVLTLTIPRAALDAATGEGQGA